MKNAAAIGYMILAAQQAGMDFEYIKCLESLMKQLMDEITEEYAEEVYRNT